jgi:predicted amidohydrolase YtcJ
VSTGLILRNVEVGGRPGLDVRLEAGRIAEIGPRLGGVFPDLDGRGGALIPGLADHHIHLLATAARDASIVLDGAAEAHEIAARIVAVAATRPAGGWLRATGYSPGADALLDRDDLDRMSPHHPIRLQDRTGGLWVLNSRALGLIDITDAPQALERGADGQPTGRIWRGDAWLRDRLGPSAPPDLSALGARLAGLGVTALMDASANTDASSAQVLADAVRRGDLPQRLSLMSAAPLTAPPDGAVAIGPVKVLLDERDLIALEDFADRIVDARRQGRGVAVHCVTAAELVLTLAAFETGGAQFGDRIEHGGVIPSWAIGAIRDLGLTVVTQPGFIAERGDRYRAEVDPGDQPDLYRLASLLTAGVPLAASSDAPYGDPDPWAAMRAAVDRRTASGEVIGPFEAVTPRIALSLHLGALDDPGGPARRVAVGAQADLCLLKAPLAEALAVLSAELVAATIVGGRLVYS